VSPLRVQIDATPLLVQRETGVSQFCRGLLSGLATNAAVEMSAYAMTRGGEDQVRAVVPGGTRVGGFPIPVRVLRASWRRLDWPPANWFLGPADLIHGTNFVVPPSSAAARVVTVHDLTPVKFRDLCDPMSLDFREFVQRAVRSGAWIHTHSSFVAAEVIDFFNADPSRVTAIWPGIPDIDEGDGQVHKATDSRPQGRYILAIGTIEPRKDFPTLVAAFDHLAHCHTDVALVIIGADGWGTSALDEAISSAHHADRISRLGYVAEADLLSWLRSSAVLAYPSRYEGFGFPPLLAMSMGTPVVATAAGAIPEVVGAAASLVPVGDADALGAALEAVLDDDALALRLRQAGPARAQCFNWSRCTAEMVGLYQAAAQQAHSR
jgi:glycosyltransferase involved in cell wall biosynthesis